jgi:pimeloyl-ACP methyl ester carboxylesterase
VKIPLLCLPGLLSTSTVWKESARNTDRAVSFACFAALDEVRDIAAAVLAEAPPMFVLAGVSMGGYVGFEMLRQAPHRIAGLCLVDTAPGADNEKQSQMRALSVQRCRERGMQAFAENLGKYVLYASQGEVPEGLQSFIAMAEEIGCETFALHQKALSRRVDSTGLLPQIRCPTVVVVGSADRVTPPAMAESMAAAIPGATFHVIEKAGHLVPMEQPLAMGEILGSFLERCDAG